MNYTELEDHLIAAKQFPPLSEDGVRAMYVLWGDDAYLKARAAQFFKTHLLDEEFLDMNYERVSVVDGFSGAIDSLMQFPLFGDCRVVEAVDVPEKINPADKILLDKYFENPNPMAVLVAVCDTDTSKSFLNHVSYVNCSHLDLNALDVEIKRVLANEPTRTMDRDAESELVNRTLGDLTRIVTELDKLKAYSDGNISKKDVMDMVVADIEYQIYEISEAVSSKNGDKTLQVLNSLLSDGVQPMTVLSNLYNHYRKMLHVSLHLDDGEDEIARLLGVKSGAVYHLKRNAKNYTQIRLKKCVDYLHAAQCSVLDGSVREADALQETVLTLLTA